MQKLKFPSGSESVRDYSHIRIRRGVWGSAGPESRVKGLPRVMVGLDDAVLEAPPLPEWAVMRHARPVTFPLSFSCSGEVARMRTTHSEL